MNFLDIIAGLQGGGDVSPASFLNPVMPEQADIMRKVDGDFMRSENAMGNNPGGARNNEITPDTLMDLRVPDRINPMDNPMDPMERQPGTSGATDFSARARSVDVPLPMPRPAGAPGPQPVSPMPPQGMPQFPQFQQNAGDLRSAIMGQPTMESRIRNVMASLGGGLSTVEGNTAGGAFARGAGGALKAGTANDRADFNDAIKALKSVQEAKQFGTSEEYKKALTSYYKILADQKNQQAAVAATGKTAATAPAKKAGKPDEIGFDGDGTQGAPYQPKTADDYAQIESGSYYTVNGQLRRKK